MSLTGHADRRAATDWQLTSAWLVFVKACTVRQNWIELNRNVNAVQSISSRSLRIRALKLTSLMLSIRAEIGPLASALSDSCQIYNNLQIQFTALTSYINYLSPFGITCMFFLPEFWSCFILLSSYRTALHE